MTLPTQTPQGVAADHDSFLCPFDCTAGWVTIRTGLTDTRDEHCECYRHSCSSSGYVDEIECSWCHEVLTPKTVAALDGPTHPICRQCYAERIRPGVHPIIQSVLDWICPREVA